MDNKESKLKMLKQELKELRIKAQPLNTAIYLKECEVYELEEEIKDTPLKDQINDCYVSLYSNKPTPEQIDTIFQDVPETIKALAYKWGWQDTEVQEALYRWLKGRKC